MGGVFLYPLSVNTKFLELNFSLPYIDLYIKRRYKIIEGVCFHAAPNFFFNLIYIILRGALCNKISKSL